MRKITIEIDAGEKTCDKCSALIEDCFSVSCGVWGVIREKKNRGNNQIINKRHPQCLAAEGLEGSGMILPRSTSDEAWQAIFRLERRVWRGLEDLRLAQRIIEKLEYKNGWLYRELQRKSDDN